MKALAPVDRVVIAYYGIIALITGIGLAFVPIPWGAAHLGWCASVIGTTMGLAHLAARGSKIAAVLHDWFPVFALLAAFQQLTGIIPYVHNFDDCRYDFALEATDRAWFGDVRGFFRSVTWAPLTDLLTICYWTYYPMSLTLVGTLWAKGDRKGFSEASTVILTAFFLSYLGYIAVPAIGPLKAVDGPRDPAFSGLWVAGALDRALMAMEGRIADAFPSGHVLVSVTTVITAWRLDRRVFRIIVVPATGLVLATMYMRYHYVVDVLGGLALVPVSIALGRRIAREPSPT